MCDSKHSRSCICITSPGSLLLWTLVIGIKTKFRLKICNILIPYINWYKLLGDAPIPSVLHLVLKRCLTFFCPVSSGQPCTTPLLLLRCCSGSGVRHTRTLPFPTPPPFTTSLSMCRMPEGVDSTGGSAQQPSWVLLAAAVPWSSHKEQSNLKRYLCVAVDYPRWTTLPWKRYHCTAHLGLCNGVLFLKLHTKCACRPFVW